MCSSDASKPVNGYDFVGASPEERQRDVERIEAVVVELAEPAGEALAVQAQFVDAVIVHIGAPGREHQPRSFGFREVGIHNKRAGRRDLLSREQKFSGTLTGLHIRTDRLSRFCTRFSTGGGSQTRPVASVMRARTRTGCD